MTKKFRRVRVIFSGKSVMVPIECKDLYFYPLSATGLAAFEHHKNVTKRKEGKLLILEQMPQEKYKMRYFFVKQEIVHV